MHPGHASDAGHQAARLRRLAEDTIAVAERLEREVATATFEGPAAERLRTSTTERSRRLRAAAGELGDLADIVVHDRPGASG